MSLRLAVPVPLPPDELLSSWLVRAALAQGCDPLALTGAIWPKWRVWTLDPDRIAGADRLKPLARMSGISEGAFGAATLRPVAAAVAGGALDGKAVWPWTLALGSRNRKRHGGLQCCPSCLAGDRSPYYRIRWRMAWHTGCSKHGRMLLDRCHHCGAPIEPHRLSAMDGHLAACATCKADLRLAERVDADPDSLAFQKAADEAVGGGEGRYGDKRLVAQEWFALARCFVTLLRSIGLREIEGLSVFGRSLGINAGANLAPATGLALELLPVDERAALLGGAWKLMEAGPEKFIDAARTAGLEVRTLVGERQVLGECLRLIPGDVSGKTRSRRRSRRANLVKPRSKRTVMRMWARLRRKMAAESR